MPGEFKRYINIQSKNFRNLRLNLCIQLHTLLCNVNINTELSEKLTRPCFQYLVDEDKTYIYFVHDTATAHTTNGSLLLL